MVFSTDSDLSYVYLQYESEKVHGLFGLGWKNQEHTVPRFVAIIGVYSKVGVFHIDMYLYYI